MSVRWRIECRGRAWGAAEFPGRWELTPEKFETWEHKLFFHENDRINLLALLLENVGADAAVRLGALEVWEAALAHARGKPRELDSRRPGGWEDNAEGGGPV